MFKPREYRYSVPFTGNPENAMSVARTSLLSLGFELSVNSEEELYAIGPGMQSNREPALLGVSKIRLRVDPDSIKVVAVLGAVAKMKAFVYIFPPALILVLISIFLISGMDVSWFYALWVLPWFLISPLIGNMFERKTINAVNRLVRGMAQS